MSGVSLTERHIRQLGGCRVFGQVEGKGVEARGRGDLAFEFLIKLHGLGREAISNEGRLQVDKHHILVPEDETSLLFKLLML